MKKAEKQKFKRKLKLYLMLVLELFIVSLLLLKIDQKNKKELEVYANSETIVQPFQRKVFFKLPILVYHYVENVTDERDTIRKSLNTPPYVLESQIKTLKDAGYVFITPSDIEKIESGQKQIVGKPIILSFDDGYRDFYTDVFPILQKERIKAIAYIVPGFLDHLNSMSSNELEEVARSGLVEVGAHTMHHVSLSNMLQAQAIYEIVESKKQLEQELKIPVVSFAYPYGVYNAQTVELVKTAGFANAVSTDSGTNEDLNEIYHLNRIHPGHRVGQSLIDAIE